MRRAPSRRSSTRRARTSWTRSCDDDLDHSGVPLVPGRLYGGSVTRALGSILLFLALAAAAPGAANAAAPDGVTGMALDGRVELAWQPAAGATGYKVYRGTSATAVSTPLMA